MFNQQHSPIANSLKKEYLSIAHEQDEQYNKQLGDPLTEKEGRNPIKVRMKVGDVEFEIECEEEQLQTAVGKILSLVTERLKEISSLAGTVGTPQRAETCKSIIQKLWEESWFDTPKNLDDVYGEMAKHGFHYDRTAVAHALIDLVKEGVLTREGKPRRYLYSQKRPPPLQARERMQSVQK